MDIDINLPPELFIASLSTFGGILVLCFVISVVYVRKFAHQAHPDLLPRIVGVLSVWTVLAVVTLLPVDVFLTSYQKNSNGTFKDWADNKTRADIGNGILYTYYACYSLLLVYLFVLIPFSYFFFEEGEDELPPGGRCCAALKYTVCFVILITALLFIGGFVPFGTLPDYNGTIIDELKFLEDQIAAKGAESALSFTLSLLTIIGLLIMSIYAAYGLSAFPLNFIKTRGSAQGELKKLRDDQFQRDERERQIKAKYADGRDMLHSDRRIMQNLRKDRERYEQLSTLVDQMEGNCWVKVQVCCRPFGIVVGLLLSLLSIVFTVSVGVTTVDKLLHSNYTMGYVLTTFSKTYPNPLDVVIDYAQMVFPLDYIILLVLVFYIAICTLDGIRRVGIWFLWIKMFEVKPQRTMPQGLLCLCSSFSISMIALNQMMLTALPTYATYGSQHYLAVTPNGTETMKCSASRDTLYPPTAGECQFTQLASLMTRFNLRCNLFGAINTYLVAFFLGCYVIGVVVAVFKRKRSILDVAKNETDDDPLLNL